MQFRFLFCSITALCWTKAFFLFTGNFLYMYNILFNTKLSGFQIKIWFHWVSSDCRCSHTCAQKDDLIIKRQLGEMRDSFCPFHQSKQLFVCSLTEVGNGIMGLKSNKKLLSLPHNLNFCNYEIYLGWKPPTTYRVSCWSSIRVELGLLLHGRLSLQDLFHGHLIVHPNAELQLPLTLSVPLPFLLDRCTKAKENKTETDELWTIHTKEM